MGKIDRYLAALAELGDGRYHYYDGMTMGIGCSEYTRLALLSAGIIEPEETFHAASGNAGVLADTSRFTRIPWSADNLRIGDILWSNGHHVATWDGKNGVYEAAPESTHGICNNRKTGVGHWPNHTYYNCGTGTKTWSCIYRIIDDTENEAPAAEGVTVDREANLRILAGYLPEISYGSSNRTVKALQAIMKKYGWYSDTVDGHAGPNTVKGIKLLQTALGVTVDGIAGAATWTALLT